MKVNNILEIIGNTPHINISSFFNNKSEVWLKLEQQNPAGSIKDRIALSMIEDAEEKGILTKESTIIEATSGNTGIGLALVAAVKKYKIILVMPDSMTIERQKILKGYGANVELTPGKYGMQGAIEKAEKLSKLIKKSWIPKQFENSSNVKSHASNTAKEIIKDFPNGIDYLIAGVGTGGHIMGCAKELKRKYKNIKIIAVEPDTSDVLSGGKVGIHSIQGIGAGFIPKKLDLNLVDEVVKVKENEALEFTIKATKELGIFMGISSGANLAVISKKISELNKNSKIVTFCYDSGERYLSIDNLF